MFVYTFTPDSQSYDPDRADHKLQAIAHDPATPLLSLVDEGVSRGDGIFETVGIFSGRPLQLTAHLERMASSAHKLQLPPLSVSWWRAAVLAAIAAESSRPGGAEPVYGLKAVHTRGLVGQAGTSRSWIQTVPAASVASPADPEVGVRLLTLNRGISSRAGELPWQLFGAKTLSYVSNMAALRHVRAQGYDEALYLSSEGELLEGPVATLVLCRDGVYLTPDPQRLPILPGTTQGALFTALRSAGLPAQEVLGLRREDLLRAEGAWMLSSLRLAAPVAEVDGQPLRWNPQQTRQLQDLILQSLS